MSPIVLLTALFAAQPDPPAAAVFAIEVVDDESGRGVPLVELRTVHGVTLITDSQGIAAFREPGLMDQSVFFHVKSHGYEFPKDGFGYRGKALAVQAGGSARLAIHRRNIAERLYRVTGAGTYRDSILAGRPVPIRHALLNAKVLGSDSVVNCVYHGKLYWFWGDTNRPSYPLGNFNVPGATSLLPDAGGLNPEIGVDLDYFVGDDGFARSTAPIPGQGPTWIDGLIVLQDSSGREHMYAAYAKVRNFLDIYERGLAEFDDDTRQFHRIARFDEKAPAFPGGHPFTRTTDGVRYVYFATPYPLIRVRADIAHLARPDSCETFTCLAPGSRLDHPKIDRNEDGSVRYGWKTGTPAVTALDQAKLLKANLLKPEEAILSLQDAATGKTVLAHAGSVYWNEYRKRWVMITAETMGTSFLGEIWYAEADMPLGPWVYARKVVTHEKYSFYNPKQHPMLAKEGGRILFFEGTYTQTFSGNPESTPIYDYNQIMYELDLSDPRLNLPVAIYRTEAEGVLGTSRQPGAKSRSRVPAFFALERAAKGTVPVYGAKGAENGFVLSVGTPPEKSSPAPALFHALPADSADPPSTSALLYEFVDKSNGSRTYAVEAPAPGAVRSEHPICRVWRNPVRVELPPN